MDNHLMHFTIFQSSCLLVWYSNKSFFSRRLWLSCFFPVYCYGIIELYVIVVSLMKNIKIVNFIISLVKLSISFPLLGLELACYFFCLKYDNLYVW
jgi:hypothetical protein